MFFKSCIRKLFYGQFHTACLFPNKNHPFYFHPINHNETQLLCRSMRPPGVFLWRIERSHYFLTHRTSTVFKANASNTEVSAWTLLFNDLMFVRSAYFCGSISATSALDISCYSLASQICASLSPGYPSTCFKAAFKLFFDSYYWMVTAVSEWCPSCAILSLVSTGQTSHTFPTRPTTHYINRLNVQIILTAFWTLPTAPLSLFSITVLIQELLRNKTNWCFQTM